MLTSCSLPLALQEMQGMKPANEAGIKLNDCKYDISGKVTGSFWRLLTSEITLYYLAMVLLLSIKLL